MLICLPNVVSECVIPQEDMTINTSSTLCQGTYYLNDSNGNGAIVINENNIVLECNGTELVGKKINASLGIYSNKKNVTIKNCKLENYYMSILLERSHNSTIFNNSLYNSTNKQITLSCGNNANIGYNKIYSNSRAIDIQVQGIEWCGTANNVSIHNNYIFNGSIGIKIFNNSGSRVYNNTINLTFDDGILSWLSSNSYIFSNMIIDVRTNGINLYSDNNHVFDNYLRNFGHVAINLYDDFYDKQITHDNYVYGNNITGTMDTGIFVQETHNTRIFSNHIHNIYSKPSRTQYNYTSGINVQGNASLVFDNFIYNNTITNSSYTCLWMACVNCSFLLNRMSNCGSVTVRLNKDNMIAQQINMGNFSNNLYVDGFTKYSNPYNANLKISVKEFTSLYHLINISGRKIIFDYSGLKDLELENHTINVHALQSPFNDLFNSSSQKIIALNQNNYTITIGPGQEIRVGNYKVRGCNLSAVEMGVGENISDAFNLSSCFSDPISQKINYSVSGNSSVKVSINQLTGMVALTGNAAANETVTFYGHGTFGRVTPSNNIILTISAPENCGDTLCSGNETCNTCSADCGICLYCGDGTCNGDESCSSCPGDCGTCHHSSGGSGSFSYIPNKPVNASSNVSSRLNATTTTTASNNPIATEETEEAQNMSIEQPKTLNAIPNPTTTQTENANNGSQAVTEQPSKTGRILLEPENLAIASMVLSSSISIFAGALFGMRASRRKYSLDALPANEQITLHTVRASMLTGAPLGGMQDKARPQPAYSWKSMLKGAALENAPQDLPSLAAMQSSQATYAHQGSKIGINGIHATTKNIQSSSQTTAINGIYAATKGVQPIKSPKTGINGIYATAKDVLPGITTRHSAQANYAGQSPKTGIKATSKNIQSSTQTTGISGIYAKDLQSGDISQGRNNLQATSNQPNYSRQDSSIERNRFQANPANSIQQNIAERLDAVRSRWH